MKVGYAIAFIRIPEHSGVPGNEIADSLTRLSTSPDGLCRANNIHIKNVQTELNYSDISLSISIIAYTYGTAPICQ